MPAGIYVANTATQTLTAGSTINLGSTIRRYGCSVNLAGNTVICEAQGYYKITGSVTATSTAGGDVTITAQSNGSAIPGATATATIPANGTVTIPVNAVVKMGCPCCQDVKEISLTAVTAATITNVAAVVSTV